MTTYDLTQTAFLFSWASNYASQVRGTGAQMAEFLGMAVGPGGQWTGKLADGKKGTWTVTGLIATLGGNLLGGDWSLVWGPFVFEHGTLKREAANSAFIVYSPSQDTYILAIAGTNPHSYYDWLSEDLKVGPKHLVDFPLKDPLKAPSTAPKDATRSQISEATALGLFNLAAKLTEPKNGLIAYLEGVSPKPTTRLIVTGHSLGGALSPAMAAQLAAILPKPWSQANIFAMPTAGPSPGNSTFAANWAAAFVPATVPVNPGNQVAQLNCPAFNTLDLVPHAWALVYTPGPGADYYATNWQSTTAPYSLDTPVGQVQNVKGVTKKKLADEFHYAVSTAQNAGTGAAMATMANRIAFTGSFPVTIWNDTTNAWVPYSLPSPPITEWSSLGAAAAVCHTWQYAQLFGLDATQIPRPIAAS